MTDAEIAEMQADALAGTPGEWKLVTIVLMNSGARVVVSPEARIGEIDCHAAFKRGDGWNAECPIRDANARRIARVPRLEATITAQAAEIARLREALAPFANQAETYDSCGSEFVPDEFMPAIVDHTIGDLRKARAALDAKP